MEAEESSAKPPKLSRTRSQPNPLQPLPIRRCTWSPLMGIAKRLLVRTTVAFSRPGNFVRKQAGLRATLESSRCHPTESSLSCIRHAIAPPW